jgi:hypothetical protein
MKSFEKTLRMIIITQEERKMATRPNIYKNKKRYTRKSKHKNNE